MIYATEHGNYEHAISIDYDGNITVLLVEVRA